MPKWKPPGGEGQVLANLSSSFRLFVSVSIYYAGDIDCIPELGPQGSTSLADFHPHGLFPLLPLRREQARQWLFLSPLLLLLLPSSLEDLYYDNLLHLFVLLKLLYPNTLEARCGQCAV